MKARTILSVWLIGMGAILALLPDKKGSVNQLKPNELLDISLNGDYLISVDKLARSLVMGDTNLLLVDLRSPENYKESSIPGAVNIPFEILLNKDFEGLLNQKELKLIFYSNGDIIAAQAWILCTNLGFHNCYIMQGGMNEWYRTVMNSRFEGEQISARENALFEMRTKAKNLFIEMNSLPDSLKINFKAMKQKSIKKLDGGCG